MLHLNVANGYEKNYSGMLRKSVLNERERLILEGGDPDPILVHILREWGIIDKGDIPTLEELGLICQALE